MNGLPETTDILIVGSGMGGATLAAGLAGSGAKIAILERGSQLADCPAARDARAIFVDGVWRPKESWLDAAGKPFNPGNYYFVGGNSKFYGAVHLRYREHDFEAFETPGGLSPAWPFPYARARAVVREGRGALPCARQERRRPAGTVALDTLSLSARAGRAGDRESAGAAEGGGAAAVHAAAGRSTSSAGWRTGARPGTPSPMRGRASSMPRRPPLPGRWSARTSRCTRTCSSSGCCSDRTAGGSPASRSRRAGGAGRSGPAMSCCRREPSIRRRCCCARRRMRVRRASPTDRTPSAGIS